MIRLRDAFDYAKKKGRVKTKTETAQKIWKNVSPKSAYVNFNNLEVGKVNSITPRLAKAIYNELGVSMDFLLGISDIENNEDMKEQVKDKANEIINIVK